ncbi:MAG: thrombospondin type 3 repeat-containing protein [Deltaproteobacteria bacterium]|nr:thrombospondin type 3 repeat-containing protein [Deltaproteobacteria bacterium]
MRSAAICVVLGLFACDQTTRTEPPAAAAELVAALVDEVGPGVVFISPQASGTRDFGDFVVTSDPIVRVDRVGAPAGTPPLAVFTRWGDASAGADAPDEVTRRIRAVLQDDPGDPADLDDDFNPVGFFQIRWQTTTAEAGQTWRISVLLPDGRAVGATDVFVAATRTELRKVDPTQATGVLAGNSVNIRFRVDAAAVDGDGDGVLDWGDNCPTKANPSQADDDGDGQGDACEACPPTQCPPGQVLDEATCGCACAPCPKGRVADPTTCACACDFPAGDPCGGSFVVDPTTCRCACPPTDCPAGMVLDAATCGCVCAADTCSGAHVQDPATCGCACPQIVRGELAPCADAGPGAILDPVACTCGCPIDTLICPPGQRPDEASCACVCAESCAPAQEQDPVDCTCACKDAPACEGGQVLDPVKCDCRCPVTQLQPCAPGQAPFPPGALCPVCIGLTLDPRDLIVPLAIQAFDDPDGACSGVAVAPDAPGVATAGGPSVDVPLVFGPAGGCPSGTCDRTFAARLTIDASGATGIDLKTYELDDLLPALSKVDCWLAYREGEGLTGEIVYLTNQGSGQAHGGGIYDAPPPDETELYVVCDGSNEPELATCPQVARHLTLTIL